MTDTTDRRHHVESMLMRESLLDKEVMASTESPVVRMLPDVHVVKIGGRSIIDAGKGATYPVVEALSKLLESEKLILGVPTGVLAQVSVADALGNAHILGTLLAPYGVVAIPPEIFGHLLPLFIH